MIWITFLKHVHKAFWVTERWKALCKCKIIIFKTVQQRCYIFCGDGTVVLVWDEHPPKLLAVIINRTITFWQRRHYFIVYILLTTFYKPGDRKWNLATCSTQTNTWSKFRIVQVMFKKHTQVSILYTNVYFSIKHSLLNTRNEF